MEWVRGVHGPCGCGGEHLYRDCPRKAEKAEKAKAEAAAAKVKEQAGAGLSAIEELSTAQLEQLVASYLGSQSDAAAGSAKVAVKNAIETAKWGDLATHYESQCGDADAYNALTAFVCGGACDLPGARGNYTEFPRHFHATPRKPTESRGFT